MMFDIWPVHHNSHVPCISFPSIWPSRTPCEKTQFTSVDTRLDGTEASQDAHLFHVADDGRDAEALEFCVDGV